MLIFGILGWKKNIIWNFMKVKEYQLSIKNKLSGIFTELEIKNEWATDVRKLELYSPTLDIAIGPFATDNIFIEQYQALQIKYKRFIEGIIDIHNTNLRDTYDQYTARDFATAVSANYNPRCFIAIEIENKVSRKHLVGGAINASALGRFGIFVAYNDEKFRAMKKLEGYFNFLSSVRKNTFNTNNLFILSKEQFSEYLEFYNINSEIIDE